MDLTGIDVANQNKYIKYVINQIQKLGQYTKLVKDGAVSLQALNYAISTYVDVLLGLTFEYNRVKNLLITTELAYETWEQERFLEARDKISADQPKSKTISQKEIQAQLVKDNKEEYTVKKMEMLDTQAQQRLMLRLIDVYKKYDGILTTLSNNMRTEMRALSVAPIISHIHKVADEADATPKRREDAK